MSVANQYFFYLKHSVFCTYYCTFNSSAQDSRTTHHSSYLRPRKRHHLRKVKVSPIFTSVISYSLKISSEQRCKFYVIFVNYSGLYLKWVCRSELDSCKVTNIQAYFRADKQRFNCVDLFEMGVRSDNSHTELLISQIKKGICDQDTNMITLSTQTD